MYIQNLDLTQDYTIAITITNHTVSTENNIMFNILPYEVKTVFSINVSASSTNRNSKK